MAPYPVLNNRPIDQWKVTELKEELKKRKLKAHGLKEELIKRLDKAIRDEMAQADDEDDVTELNEENPGEVAAFIDQKKVEIPSSNEEKCSEALITHEEKTEEVHEINNTKTDEMQLDPQVTENEIPEIKVLPTEDSLVSTTNVKEPLTVSSEDISSQHTENAPATEGVEVPESVEISPDVHLGDSKQTSNDALGNESLTANVDTRTIDADGLDPSSQPNMAAEDQPVQVGDLMAVEDQPLQVEADLVASSASADTVVKNSSITFRSVDATSSEGVDTGSEVLFKDQSDCDHPVSYEAYKDSKPAHDGSESIVPELSNQVSQVSPDLGETKYESFSTNYMSTNENNNLKDNFNAGNFDLDVEVKTEMVQPSSEISALGDDLQPMDDDKQLVKNQSSLEEIGYTTANIPSTKKEYSAGSGSPEKLNLDRSSGDESMDEDLVESKPADLAIKLDEPLNSNEVNKVDDLTDATLLVATVKDESLVDASTVVNQEKANVAAPAEKRKLEAEESSTHIVKRPRVRSSENVKVAEKQSYNIAVPSAPKDVFQPTLKRSFGRPSPSPVSDTPKERIVPPSLKPATTSLRIDQFVRPFTLKAVQELLAKTGTVSSFWMDQIKTHCYVTYSSLDEAVATRNAVYNLQWPPNGGKHLVADFVDPQEVKARIEAPPPSPAPINPSPSITPRTPYQQNQANNQTFPQQLPPPPPLMKPPPFHAAPAKEKLPLPPPPPVEKPEPLVLTLDDLFKKTKASPRIYYLPISEEEVQSRVAANYLAYK